MLIKKGAEANLYLEPFTRVLHQAGKGKVVVKARIKKSYRIAELDIRLRESRTAQEAKLLFDAKRAGVPTPAVYEVDKSKMRIVMEYVEGRQAKLVLDKLGPAERRRLCHLIGKYIARLHRSGIIHGDLTTSNMIVKPEGKVYFIDFGLGGYNSSIEERGVDLHLMKRALQSIHFRIADRAYLDILLGYQEEFGEGAEEIIERAKDIESRGRYVSKEERSWR
ncbi:MAG: Kae1-associated kinase Bud32 [Candidatus Hadarchaeaceae archaeon]